MFNGHLLLVVLLPCVFAACTPAGNPDRTVTDIDGNHYGTVAIGGKRWMSENLRVSRYRNGDPIPEVTDSTAWGGLRSGAWSTYALSEALGKAHGKLYNWHAVNDPRGLAPAGWHVATDVEWRELVEAAGGRERGGAALKARTGWSGSSAEGTAPDGFNALPSGARRDSDGEFVLLGQFARFWSSTASGPAKAYGWAMEFYDEAVRSGEVKKENGFSVRCVQD